MIIMLLESLIKISFRDESGHSSREGEALASGWRAIPNEGEGGMARGHRAPQGDSARSCAGLRFFSPFSHLTSEEDRELSSIAYPVERDSGDLVFQAGRPAEGFYLVQQGKVKLVQETPDKSKRYILKILGPGELLGEEAFFAAVAHSAWAEALEPTRLCFLPGDEVIDFVARYPGMGLRLLRQLARDVQHGCNMQVELAYTRSEVRLARALLRLGRKFGRCDGDMETIDLGLTRTELAQLVGLRPETTIRILSDWRGDGILSLEDHTLIVTRRNRLAQIAAFSEDRSSGLQD